MPTFVEQAESWASDKYPNHTFCDMEISDWIQLIEMNYIGGWRQFVSERYQ